MMLIRIILWAFAIISVGIFLDLLFSYIRCKWAFWRMSVRVKRAAKKHTGEVKEELNALSKNLMELSKNHKFMDMDDLDE